MPVPIYNPIIPFVGVVEGGLHPGKLVRIQGSIPISASRFAINLQCGPNVTPRDDIALHFSPRFHENFISRNSLHGVNWGPDETSGHMPLVRGQGFEIIILCDPDHYKIAINGQHYTEFIHRIPYHRVNYLSIDGDVTISTIFFESAHPSHGHGHVPPAPYPVAPGHIPPYPTHPSGAIPPYPVHNAGPGPYPTLPGGHGPYPTQPAGPCPFPGSGSPYPHPGGYGTPGQPMTTPSGYYYPAPSSGNKGLGGILEKASAAVSGVLGTSGRGGGGGSSYGKAAVGTGLGAGLLGAAVSSRLSPKKQLKAQRKAHKKALKYGLPIAGVAGAGLGAYAISKGLGHHHHHHGFHHHKHSSSSSSSSSSSEEE